jgi:hypothetical protein
MMVFGHITWEVSRARTDYFNPPNILEGNYGSMIVDENSSAN